MIANPNTENLLRQSTAQYCHKSCQSYQSSNRTQLRSTCSELLEQGDSIPPGFDYVGSLYNMFCVMLALL